MAESVVSFLIEKLATLTVQEIEILSSVRKEITSITEEFQSIKILLRNADSKADIDEGVKEWLTQVRGVAYEIEDVLDEYILRRHMERDHVRETPRNCIGSINNVLEKIKGLFKCLKNQHEVVTQIKDIKERIQEISSRKERYALSSSDAATSSRATAIVRHDPREDALFLEETDVVGIDQPKEELIRYISEANTKLSVITVLGEGGLGKTTVVKKVFDTLKVKENFQFRAWVIVSQTPDTKDLLKDLLNQLFPQLQEEGKTYSIIKLKQILNNELRGKRYLVVLDDIWTVPDWKELKNALPDDNESGSRILTTTRKQEVADMCAQHCGRLYPLQRLDSHHSWKLFHKKICSSKGTDMNLYPKDLLQDQSEKFLKKCNGLPLAIVAVGGLLSEKHPSEWDRIYQTLGSLMDHSTSSPLGDLNMVISFSFNDLPHHLKSCFLYLCMFPEDYSIGCSRLRRLWVAQGFVQTKPGVDLSAEEIAEFYLDELIRRSLIQAERKDERKRVTRCRIHDLVRDHIIGKARDQNFAEVIYRKQDELGLLLSDGLRPQPRHQSICKLEGGYDAENNTLFKENNRSAPRLRSLLIFPELLFTSASMTINFSSFRLLKVLDLQRTPDPSLNGSLKCFPNEVVNLYYLRYLSLRGHKGITTLPNSVGKLLHLETLDLKGTDIRRVPVGFLKLRQLRNLLTEDAMKKYRWLVPWGVALPVGIDCLVALEKLAVVHANEFLVKELGMLTQLRTLAISHLIKDDGKHLFASIERMKHLRSLKLRFQPDQLIDLQSLRSPPLCLRCLFMRGALMELPKWFCSLNKLEKLTLESSHLKNDYFQVLQVLPNLVLLELRGDAFDCEELSITKQGFPRLKKLHLSMTNLKKVVVEQGSMPVIQEFRFNSCKKLEELPHGINHLVTLRTINCLNMPSCFAKQVHEICQLRGYSSYIYPIVR